MGLYRVQLPLMMGLYRVQLPHMMGALIITFLTTEFNQDKRKVTVYVGSTAFPTSIVASRPGCHGNAEFLLHFTVRGGDEG